MKMKPRRLISALLTVMMVFALNSWTSPAQAAIDITAKFTDSNFRAAVYQTISKSAPAPIYDSDVASILGLYTNGRGIQSLAGLEYFTSLTTLDCTDNQLTSLPALPGTLTGLWCTGNRLTSLPALHTGLEYLTCDSNQIAALPTLPSGLKELDCKDNRLTVLPSLPSSLLLVHCSGNALTALPALPSSLRYLVCPDNRLSALPVLPSGLYELFCGNNSLASLPALPSSMYGLWCAGNNLTSLPSLPSGLSILYCGDNRLASLPALPSDLESLGLSGNVLTSLPELPSRLRELYCDHNHLTRIDVTGLSSLRYFNCSYNCLANESAVIGFSSWDGLNCIFNPQNLATISPTSITFEKNNSEDITLTVDTAGYIAQSIKNGSYTLQPGTDFVISNITSMTLSAAYLNTLDAGTHTLSFNFSGGTSPTLTITVTAPASVAPTITGPTAMTLTAGYTATSTGEYTITGTPDPAVTIISSSAAILWNDSTNKLEIGAGISAGTYPVVLTATSGENTATLVFTLTVTPGGGTPFPFTDVPESAWYYTDVKTAWEQGLINGKSDTLFAPEDNLTYAEAVKLAACMFQLSFMGSITLTNGSPNWYDSYVAYAKEYWLITKDYEWNAPATRAGYMEIFMNAAPLTPINDIADGAIPDVPMTHPQSPAIYWLYRCGIVQGVDAARNCNPDSSIKRSEVAAILTRMMNEGVRLFFSL